MRKFRLANNLVLEILDSRLVVSGEHESNFSVGCSLSEEELIGLVMFVGDSVEFLRRFCPTNPKPDFSKKIGLSTDVSIDFISENFLFSFTCSCTSLKFPVEEQRLHDFAIFFRECLLDRIREI